MYRVAICDDDNIILEYISEKISSILDKRNEVYEICKFNSGETALDAIISKELYFDAIFLDIEMGKMSGLEVANKITSISDQLNIVFVTNRDDLVFDAIDYRPFSFIRKSKLKEELELVIHKLLQKKDKVSIYFDIEIDKKLLKIDVNDIIWMESNGHYINIICKDHKYKIRGKIFEYEAKMIEAGFIRIHIAFLVNVRHIRFVKYDGVYLDNETILPISRKKFEQTKNIHLEYVRGCAHGNN